MNTSTSSTRTEPVAIKHLKRDDLVAWPGYAQPRRIACNAVVLAFSKQTVACAAFVEGGNTGVVPAETVVERLIAVGGQS